MQLVPSTVSMSDFSKAPKEVASAVAKGPVMVMNRTTTVGMLVNPEQWNRMVTELENLRLLAESRRISARNDLEGTWIDEDEMDRRMIERGVFTEEELRREPEHVTVAN